MAQVIFLADTNVVSELVKKVPDVHLMRWLQTVEHIAVSVVTIEEAHFGLAWQLNSRKLALFNAMVQRMHKVYPISESIAARAGKLRGQLQAQGIVRSAPDMLIAATALEHQLIVATRNTRDFLNCALELVDPFVPMR